MKPPAQPTLHSLILSCAPWRSERTTAGHRCPLRPRACRSLALPDHQAGPVGAQRERAPRPPGGRRRDRARARCPPGRRHRLRVTEGRHQGQEPLGTVLSSEHRSPQGLPIARSPAGTPEAPHPAPEGGAPPPAARAFPPSLPPSRRSRARGRAPSPTAPLTWRASGSLHSRPRGAVRRGPGRPRRLRGGAAPRRTHRPGPPPPPLRLPPTAGPAIPRSPLPAEPAAPHPPPPPRCLAVGTVLAERPPCSQSQCAPGAAPPPLRVGGTTGQLRTAPFNPFTLIPAALGSADTVGGFLQACLHKLASGFSLTFTISFLQSSR